MAGWNGNRTPRRPDLRPTLRIAVLLMAGATALAAQGEEAGERRGGGLFEVAIDLEGRRFDAVLPFDEHISIQGPVAPGVEEVAVSFIERRRDFQVRPDEGGEPVCVELERRRGGGGPYEARPVRCAWSGEVARWRRPATHGAGAGEPGRFQVTVPPLDANRYYVFRFDVRERLSPEVLERFGASARRVLHRALGRETDLDRAEEEIAGLQRRLLEELRSLAGHESLELTGAGYFTTDYRELGEGDKLAFVLATQRVLEANRNLVLAASDWGRLAVSLEGGLEELHRRAITPGAPLARLRAALEARATEARDVALLLDTHGAALRPLLADDEERARLARGWDPEGESPPPSPRSPETWPPAVPRAMAGRYEDLHARLRELEELLASLLAAGGSMLEPLLGEDRLSSEEVAALRAEVPPLLARARGDAFALAGRARRLEEVLEERRLGLDALAGALGAQARRQVILVDASTTGTFQTRQSWYLSVDFGVMAAPDLDEIVPYVGTNIYLRPVNKQVPLSQRDSLGRRFALTVGVTVEPIGDDRTRDDLFGAASLLLGAGVRLTESARLGAGVLLFRERDPNPLIDDDSLTYTPYATLSFDWDVRGWFSRVFPWTRDGG